MNLEEFVPLSPQSVQQVLDQRAEAGTGQQERRREGRWTFPGPVELWVPCCLGEEDEYILATCRDLSGKGVGVLSERELPLGLTLPIAIHQPEATFHGEATVRHCMRKDDEFIIGLEFLKP